MTMHGTRPTGLWMVHRAGVRSVAREGASANRCKGYDTRLQGHMAFEILPSIVDAGLDEAEARLLFVDRRRDVEPC